MIAVLGILFRRLWRPTPKASNQTATLRDGTSIPMSSSPGSTVFSASVERSVVAVGTNISQVFVESLHHHESRTPETVLINTEPTPLQMLSDVKAALHYDKHAVQEKCVGINAAWRLRLGSITRREGIWSVTCDFVQVDGSMPIGCNVTFDLPSVPAPLRAARQGSLIWVKGEVESFSGWYWTILSKDPEILKVHYSQPESTSRSRVSLASTFCRLASS